MKKFYRGIEPVSDHENCELCEAARRGDLEKFMQVLGKRLETDPENIEIEYSPNFPFQDKSGMN